MPSGMVTSPTNSELSQALDELLLEVDDVGLIITGCGVGATVDVQVGVASGVFVNVGRGVSVGVTGVYWDVNVIATDV